MTPKSSFAISIAVYNHQMGYFMLFCLVITVALGKRKVNEKLCLSQLSSQESSAASLNVSQDRGHTVSELLFASFKNIVLMKTINNFTESIFVHLTACFKFIMPDIYNYQMSDYTAKYSFSLQLLIYVVMLIPFQKPITYLELNRNLQLQQSIYGHLYFIVHKKLLGNV